MGACNTTAEIQSIAGWDLQRFKLKIPELGSVERNPRIGQKQKSSEAEADD